MQSYNKTKQIGQPFRCAFCAGFAFVAQKSQQKVCRCWRRYMSLKYGNS